MENNDVLKRSTMTYGLYLGLSFSIVIGILKMLGIVHYPGDSAGSFNTIILGVGFLYFGRLYRENWHDGIFTYKNALSFTLRITIFSSIVYCFFIYWYYMFFEPGAIEFYIEQVKLAYTQAGTLNDEQINTFMEIYKTTLTPGIMTFVTLVFQITIGAFMGLVVSNLIKTPQGSVISNN